MSSSQETFKNDIGKKVSSWEKQFKIRKSPLTERFEKNEDIKAIYNIFLIIVIILFINTVLYDYSKTGESYFGFRLIILGFNRFDLVILIWLGFNFLTYLVYLSFILWAKVRTTLKPTNIKFWDEIWLIILLSHYFLSLFYVHKSIKKIEFAAGSATVLVLEQLRFVMKQHAFIRTIAPRVLNYKLHSDQKLNLPNLTKFIYFVYVPTLIYRDEYPRTTTIRWKFVFYNLGEIFGVIFFLSLTIDRFFKQPFEDICLRKFGISEMVILITCNIFPSVIILLCMFYSILHSTQNAVGEILTFGDRMFYKEWWTSKSLAEYYRNWNVVVHEWLYIYVYKDMYEIVCPKNKLIATVSVFMLSATVHEWGLMNVLGVFFPIQFYLFFIGSVTPSLFKVVNKPIGNFAFLFLLVIGIGIKVNTYAAEYFANRNCPQIENGSFEFFKPRFLSCGCIE